MSEAGAKTILESSNGITKNEFCLPLELEKNSDPVLDVDPIKLLDLLTR